MEGVLVVRRPEDITRAKRENKAGIILGNEGSLPLGGSVETLKVLYRKGLREIALYWPAGNHTRHVLNQDGTPGGIDTVGIGADYFPYNPRPVGKAFEEQENCSIEDRDWSKTYVDGLEKISGLPLLTQGLVRRGFADDDIRKILGGNAVRVFQAVWKA